MFRDHKVRALIEKIDDAIEQAEDLGLTFVAGILMMARLETVQTEQLRIVGHQNKQLSRRIGRSAATGLPVMTSDPVGADPAPGIAHS